MRGNVLVEDQVSSPLTSELYDTVGILMNPTMDLTTQTTDLESRVFSILDTHNFKDLRGGQEGTGDELILVLWGISNSDVGNAISQVTKYHKDFYIANSSILFYFIYLYWIRLRKNNVPSANSIFYRPS
jgi:hypothetical protein